AWGLALSVACAGSVPAGPTTSAAPQRMAGLVLGLGSLVALSLASGRGSGAARIFRLPAFSWTSPAALALAWLGWTALGLAWGIHAGALDVTTWVGASLFALAASKVGVFAARAAARRGALLLGLAQSACALFQVASHRPVVGLSGNPDWLGLLLGVCLPLTADLAFGGSPRAQRRRSRGEVRGRARGRVRAGVAIALAPMLLAFLVAGSRVAMASLSLALVTALALSFRRRAEGHFAVALPASSVPSSFRDASLARAFADRMWIWRHALTAAEEAPVAGVGTGRFAHAYLVAQGRGLAKEAPDAAARHFVNATSAHGSFVHALVENGVPGAILLLAATARLLFALRGSSPLLWAASLTLALEMVGDVPLHLPPVAYLGALLLVCAAVRRPRRRGPLRWSSAVLVGAGVAAAWSASVAARSYVGAWIRESARLDPSVDPLARDAALRRAVRVDPKDGETLLQAGLSALELGDAARGRGLLLRSSSELADVGTWVALGNADAALGDRDAAERWYRGALDLDAGSLKAHVNLAEVCRRRRDLDCAASHLAAAKRIAPFHPKVRALEDRLRDTDGDTDADTDADTDLGPGP
ncbi:MAG: hypothetical protein HOO96_37420, partial [Polyangiaceae bacterium]|nr:hypothetical protein [Polyangiaceae bacterium]